MRLLNVCNASREWNHSKFIKRTTPTGQIIGQTFSRELKPVTGKAVCDLRRQCLS
jgi:hypothetical protein